MSVTVTKISFERSKPRTTDCRDYNPFENKKLFREELLYELLNAILEENVIVLQEFINSKKSYPKQSKVCSGVPFAIYEENPLKINNA